MFQRKNPLTLIGLCSALAACDGAPTHEPLAPEDPVQTLDAQSASLLAASNTWAARRGLPTARSHHKAATLDNIIYVVGGQSASLVFLSRVDAYDVATNTWSPRKPLPSPRWLPNGVSVINGRLYVSGGRNVNRAETKTLYVYTPGTNSWVRKADMPTAGACGVQGVIGGLLYVNTGCGEGNQRFYRYNPGTNHWTTLASPPSRHEYGVGGVIGGKFYLAGGGFDSHLDVFNPTTHTWATRAPVPENQPFMAGAVLNGKLFVAGGFDASPEPIGVDLTTLRAYSPGTNTWTTKAPLPTPRSVAAGAAAGGLFFVIGGYENNGPTRKVVAYTP